MYKLLCSSVFIVQIAWAASVDPTAPYLHSHSSSSVMADNVETGMKIQAIIRKHDQLMAMINGKLLKQGDSVGRNTIVFIDQFSVTFANSGEQFTVRLFDVDLGKAE